MRSIVRILGLGILGGLMLGRGAFADESVERLLRGRLKWTSSGPLVAPVERPQDPCVSIKDPTVVFHDGRWHLFGTIRSEKRSHQIEYLSFTDWNGANAAPRHVLKVSDGYFCAPQVFWMTPLKKWVLLYQVAHPGGKPTLLPAMSTSETLDDPDSWSKPVLLFDERPGHVSGWIDFWVICDDTRAHLFFTSNDGRMWRCATAIGDFPRGWDSPQVVLSGDIFEASHTYRLRGTDQFLTVIEAQGERGRRYYKAYVGDRLDGEWKPIADSADRPFASTANVSGETGWTTSYSHGELLRSGVDEHLEVDAADLRFLYQGVADADREGVAYGKIPWRLGLLTCE